MISQALRDLPENMSRAELINSTDRAISHRSGGYLKYATADESRMGAALQGIMVAMKSPSFLTFLEVTGIGPLLVDDTNNGGGIHQISRQGSLQIHADFNMQSPDFHRRVNAFLYLNPAWDSDAWHGDLELWDRSMTTCMQRIAPIANRLHAPLGCQLLDLTPSRRGAADGGGEAQDALDALPDTQVRLVHADAVPAALRWTCPQERASLPFSKASSTAHAG